jgi:hypothetical protein
MGCQIETIVDGIQGAVFHQAHGDVGDAHLVGEGDGRLAGLTVGARPQDVPMAALVTTSLTLVGSALARVWDTSS